MNPEQAIDVLLTLDPLADLPRTGWRLRGIDPCESIADHSFGVAVMAMMLVDGLRAGGTDIDAERTLRLALVHDAPEAFTGDIPMPSKTPELDKELDALETRLFAKHLPASWQPLWAELLECTSLEARVVKASDKLQMMVKVLRYERTRGAMLEDFWRNPKNFDDKGIELASNIFDAICERAERTRPV
jgi:putative hydrolase of HD superfamily